MAEMTPEQAGWFADTFARLVGNMELAIVGKAHVIRLALTCLLSDGHLLLEDFPGTGKTSLAKSLAQTVKGTSSRIQFTPDLLPSDVTGVTVYEQRGGTFEFHPGPDFRHHCPGRRDQPGLPEDAVRAAGGHGGGAGDGGRRPAPRRTPVHGRRHPEPDRAGRDLSSARGAAGPFPHEDEPRVPRSRVDREPVGRCGQQGQDGGGVVPHYGAGRLRYGTTGGFCPCRPFAAGLCEPHCGGVAAYPKRSTGNVGARLPLVSCASRRRGPRPTDATTWFLTTSKSWRYRSCPIAFFSRPKQSSTASTSRA